MIGVNMSPLSLTKQALDLWYKSSKSGGNSTSIYSAQVPLQLIGNNKSTEELSFTCAENSQAEQGCKLTIDCLSYLSQLRYIS